MHVAVEQLVQNCTESARLINENAVKHDQKLIKYMDHCNEYIHKIGGQFHEQFVRKCPASAQTIRGIWKFNEVWTNLNQIWGSPNDNSNKFVQNA